MPGSLSATLALILIGAGITLTAERRKLAQVRSVNKRDRRRGLNADDPCRAVGSKAEDSGSIGRRATKRR